MGVNQSDHQTSSDDGDPLEQTRRLVEMHERERQLLGLEIHDGIVQDIVGAKMLVETAAARLPPQEDRAAELLVQCSEILRKAIEDARGLIGRLRPLKLDGAQLSGALDDLIAENSLHNGTSIEVEYDNSVEQLPPILCGAIFRIVQEAARNVKRHSQASQANVRISRLPGRVEIEIRDNGIGFRPEQIPSNCFGIRGISERAGFLGGSAEVVSIPDHGTTIVVQIPSSHRAGDS